MNGDNPELHPLVQGFEDAEAYDRGRPAYGPEVVGALCEELALESGAPVLELGPGTGQLSRALLAAGLDLTAVEPLASMREMLADAIGPQRVRAGFAEEIPLAAASVDAVFAADSFHWFDESRTLPELRRVLRPRGGVAILRTTPVLDAIWTQELNSLVSDGLKDHPAFGERGAADALAEDRAFGPVKEITITTERTVNRLEILAYLATISWVAALPRERRLELLAHADETLRREEIDELRHGVVHRIWMTRLV